MTTISLRVGASLVMLCALPVSLRAQDAVAELNTFLDAWHHAAAVAAESTYFAAMDSDAVYLGTDPGERWSKQAFRDWAKPYFARGKAWAFTPFGRHITVAAAGDVAWFDENLKWFDDRLRVWMGTLRGSGVVRRTAAGWRIVQYNLAMELPNDRLGDVVRLLRVSHAVPGPDAQAILATVRGLLGAYAARDTAWVRAALDPDARITVVTGDDSTAHSTAQTAAEYVRAATSAPAGVRDSVPETTLLGDGSMAFVWAPVQTYEQGRRAGCGLDQFQLVREGNVWRISSIVVHRSASCPDGSN